MTLKHGDGDQGDSDNDVGDDGGGGGGTRRHLVAHSDDGDDKDTASHCYRKAQHVAEV